jgi:4-amino-4-deoxy-L-arabinose transferase-like glycosyltransferase
MESRNIITAREMVYDGHWFLPTMNGELRLEKPPLPTWIAGVVEKITPDNLSVQRAMAGITAIIWIIFLYLFGKKITDNKEYAFIASLLFLTCYNVILMGRTATWDIYCHSFMMGAIYFMYRGLFENKHPYRWFSFAGIFLGLSFMSKGPVSFYTLLLPFLLCIFFFKKPKMRDKWYPLLIMIFICLILSSWWYIFLFVYHPDAIQYIIHKESSSWINHNVRPWWYYWKFFLETGVWSLLMITTLIFPYWKKRLEMKREYLFFISWGLIELLLLSLMPEKKPRYLLPMMVPCCYAMSCLIEHFTHNNKEKSGQIFYYINTGAITLVSFSLPILLYKMFYCKNIIDTRELIFLSLILWSMIAILFYSTIHWKPLTFLGGIVALFASVELFMMPLIGNLTNNPDFKSIKETRNIKMLNNIPFYYNLKESLRIELVYEAYRKIRPLDLKDEQAVLEALPCVILTRKHINEELSADLLNKIDTTYIGFYNDNRRPEGNEHYSTSFLNNVTLLKIKSCKQTQQKIMNLQ